MHQKISSKIEQHELHPISPSALSLFCKQKSIGVSVSEESAALEGEPLPPCSKSNGIYAFQITNMQLFTYSHILWREKLCTPDLLVYWAAYQNGGKPSQTTQYCGSALKILQLNSVATWLQDSKWMYSERFLMFSKWGRRYSSNMVNTHNWKKAIMVQWEKRCCLERKGSWAASHTLTSNFQQVWETHTSKLAFPALSPLTDL